MQAAFITQTGPAESIQIGNLPDPQPGPHDVIVRVQAVAVNPIDTYIRSGAISLPIPFPYVIGCDLAGTVQQIGAAVTRLQTGDRVYGTNQGIAGRQGTFSEFACVHEDWLYPTPQSITDEQAAAGALVTQTAAQGLFLHGRLQAGETLFVNGGSGGVGSVVVQTAKAIGARVITTAGSEEKKAYCQSIGADVVLDHRADDLDLRLQNECETHGKVDFWWETLREPNLPRTIRLMAKRGRIILMAGRDAQPTFPLGQFYTNDLSLIGFAMFNASAVEQQQMAARINDLYQAGKLQIPVGITLPLSEAARAHQLQEEKTLQKTSPLHGKIVLNLG